MSCRVSQELVSYQLKEEKLEEEWFVNKEDRQEELFEIVKNTIDGEDEEYLRAALGKKYQLLDDEETDILLQNLDRYDPVSFTMVKILLSHACMYEYGLEICELFDNGVNGAVQSMFDYLEE